MTYKEALKSLKYEVYEEGHCSYIEEELDLAMMALEMRVPKKPTKLESKLLIDSGWVYKCPTCGCACGENKYHLEVTQDDMYCTQCGQALDWD